MIDRGSRDQHCSLKLPRSRIAANKKDLIMATVQIKEGNQLVLNCDVADIADHNEFIRSLVAEAKLASDGLAEREDSEGCLVTAIYFADDELRYALVSDCTPNNATIVAISSDAGELIDLHIDDTMRAIRLEIEANVGDRIAVDWDASQVNLADCM
jgi:hypothetical protein